MRRDLVAALTAAGGVFLATAAGAPAPAAAEPVPATAAGAGAAERPTPLFREPLPLPDFAVGAAERPAAAPEFETAWAGQSWAEAMPDDALSALRGGRVHGVLVDIDGATRLADGREGRLGGTLFVDDAGRLTVHGRRDPGAATAGVGAGAGAGGTPVETFIGGLSGFNGIGQFVQVTGDNNVVEANLLITLNVFLAERAQLPGLSRLPFVNQAAR